MHACKTLDPTAAAARDLAAGRLVIRTMSAADMAAVTIPWMAAEAWNPGLHDAETFVVADPDGFHVGLLDGEPIATVSGVRYDDQFAFLGCYIVRSDQRGKGYGLAMHEEARRRLNGCVQGGDGVLENVAVYEQIGRVLAYRNARYEGVVPRHERSARAGDRTGTQRGADRGDRGHRSRLLPGSPPGVP